MKTVYSTIKSNNSEIIIDESKMLQTLRLQIKRLVATPLLNADQKFNVLNDYISPTVIFPFQQAPLSKLPMTLLNNIDKILKSAVKEILQIPNSTPDSMIYSSRKVKGLGLMKASWEAFIQSFNASDYLQNVNMKALSCVRDFESEKMHCLNKLSICEELKSTLLNRQLIDHTRSTSNMGKKGCKIIRNELQKEQFDAWCALPTKGRGVCQFGDYPAANKWLTTKFGLSTSEWVNAIKMTGNVLPVKTNPGYGQGNSRCRHCDEYETLGHILGKCSRGELLRNNRHHAIRSLLAAKLKEKGWSVEEEVACRDVNGISRRVDIFALNRATSKGYIIDPTVRMEGDHDQATSVDIEKGEIYSPCVPYFRDKYNVLDVKVIGLYDGARGTITQFFVKCLKDFKIPLSIIEMIVSIVLKSGNLICNHNLFNGVT